MRKTNKPVGHSLLALAVLLTVTLGGANSSKADYYHTPAFGLDNFTVNGITVNGSWNYDDIIHEYGPGTLLEPTAAMVESARHTVFQCAKYLGYINQDGDYIIFQFDCTNLLNGIHVIRPECASTFVKKGHISARITFVFVMKTGITLASTREDIISELGAPLTKQEREGEYFPPMLQNLGPNAFHYKLHHHIDFPYFDREAIKRDEFEHFPDTLSKIEYRDSGISMVDVWGDIAVVFNDKKICAIHLVLAEWYD